MHPRIDEHRPPCLSLLSLTTHNVDMTVSVAIVVVKGMKDGREGRSDWGSGRWKSPIKRILLRLTRKGSVVLTRALAARINGHVLNETYKLTIILCLAGAVQQFF